jgi:hypothetical protein
MRIWHRMKHILLLLLVLSISASASAQGLPGVPGGGLPAFNAGQPGAAAINYQGVPPSFLPHPHLSPYEHASQQHVNDNGLWYSDTVSHFEERGIPFTYNVQVEWLQSSVRGFNGRVGDRFAPTLAEIDNATLIGPQILQNRTLNLFQPLNMDDVPTIRPSGLKVTTSIKSREGWALSFHGMWNDNTSQEFSARADRDKYRIDEIDAIILEATGGVTDPTTFFNTQRNTSDLEIAETFLLVGDPLDFDSGDLIDWDIRGVTSDILNRTLISQLNLPLQNGEFPNGRYQRFDIEFAIRHSVGSYGAGAHFETDTIFERSGIKFRGLVGGRYMRINEGFHFRGRDSGLLYDVSNDIELIDRIDNDGDFVVDNIDEGGSGGSYEVYNPSSELLIRSFVDNIARTDAAGPEFGFAYDIGKRAGLSFSGSTHFGALFNNERIRLAGDNIGIYAPGESIENTLDVDPITNEVILRDLFDTSTANGPTQNAFTDGVSSKHISPMIEQSLNAQLPLFSQVPVLRDMRVLENATLQAGYTFLWIGEVADPSNSVVWASNPRAGLFPTINVNRTDFYQHTFRLGINCEY